MLQVSALHVQHVCTAGLHAAVVEVVPVPRHVSLLLAPCHPGSPTGNVVKTVHSFVHQYGQNSTQLCSAMLKYSKKVKGKNFSQKI